MSVSLFTINLKAIYVNLISGLELKKVQTVYVNVGIFFQTLRDENDSIKVWDKTASLVTINICLFYWTREMYALYIFIYLSFIYLFTLFNVGLQNS